jgi:hypothetical protein
MSSEGRIDVRRTIELRIARSRSPLRMRSVIPTRSREGGSKCTGHRASKVARSGMCSLPPVTGGNEAGPVERMGAQPRLPPPPELREACPAHGFHRASPVGESMVVQARHPATRVVIGNRPEAHDHGSRASDAKRAPQPEDALAGPDLTYSRIASRQHGPFDGMKVERRHFFRGQNAVLLAEVGRLPAIGATPLVYSSYLGGSQMSTIALESEDAGLRIASIRHAGTPYVIGFTRSPDFPVANAQQPVFGGGLCGFSGYTCADAFITKIQASQPAWRRASARNR